ncbi:MAG: NuoI/complex I 23 kDa subunit family protein [Holophagaceae bacterium]|nr:NADH-quinone oxidoreductase subunit I [Acidobacteriota bacterium]
MATLVKKIQLSWWDRLYFPSVLKGMWITWGHFIRQILTPTSKRFTIQYPEMKKEMPEGYRGLHELKQFEDGSIKCVACFMCQEACPARCITIEAEEFSDLNFTQGFEEKRPKVFKIDMLRCIYCGMCEEACPKDAIWLRKDYELAAYDRLSLNYGKWDLMNTYADTDGKPIQTESSELPPSPPRNFVTM